MTIKHSQKGMTTPWIVIMIAAVVAIGGIGFLITRPQPPAPVVSTEQGSKEKAMMKPSESPTTTEGAMMKKGESRYLAYSRSVFDTAKDKKRVLYFYANWCPICRPIDKEFSTNMDKIPDGVVVIRVNYNDSDTDADEKDLANKYGITYQHTFVQIDAVGNKIAFWNGGGLAELITNVK